MRQLSRGQEMLLGIAFIAFGPAWAVLVSDMGLGLMVYAFSGYFVGCGIALLLLGLRIVVMVPFGALCGAFAYFGASFLGASA